MADKTSKKPAAAQPWSLRNLRDTRENVIESIRSSAFVPPLAKEFLIERIQTNHPTAVLLRVDVHCHVIATAKGKKDIGHWDISEI